MAGLRPLLVESGDADETLRVNFYDVHGIAAAGGRAAVEIIDGNVFIVLSLRNVGSGIAVLHGGKVYPVRQMAASPESPPLDEFRVLRRDIYIPPKSIGFWQIAFREEEEERAAIMSGIEYGYLMADVLYGDFEGGQRAVTRLGIAREEDGAWHLTSVRHWQVDRDEPRRRD